MLFQNPVLNILVILLLCLAGILLFSVLVIVLVFSFVFAVCLTIDKKKDFTKFSPFYYGVYIFACRFLCFIAGIRIHVSGKEKVPAGCRFLMVSNHRSNFDNIIQGIVFKGMPIAYISKPENFKIPFVGRLVKRCLFLAIQRGNLRSGLEIIHRAIEYISSDVISIGVYPEGTRSKDYKLLPFKPGCFKIAEKAKCPLIVVATRGTEFVHKNKAPWKHTDVYIDILEVFMPEDMEGKRSVEICNMANEKISSFLAENDIY